MEYAATFDFRRLAAAAGLLAVAQRHSPMRAKSPAASVWLASRSPPKPSPSAPSSSWCGSPAAVHLTRIVVGAGVAGPSRPARRLPMTCDVGITLLLTENDIGYFNPHARFCPPLRDPGATVRPCPLPLPLAGLPSVPTIRRSVPTTSCCLSAKPSRAPPAGSAAAADLKWAEAAKVDPADRAGPHYRHRRRVLGSWRVAWPGGRHECRMFASSIRRDLATDAEALKSRGKNSPGRVT